MSEEEDDEPLDPRIQVRVCASVTLCMDPLLSQAQSILPASNDKSGQTDRVRHSDYYILLIIIITSIRLCS